MDQTKFETSKEAPNLVTSNKEVKSDHIHQKMEKMIVQKSKRANKINSKTKGLVDKFQEHC